MVRFIKKIRNFQFKGILMILGCFILIAAALFAERSGVQYQEKKRQISYIDKNKIITEKEAADSLKKTCLVLRDSSQKESEQAWIEFQRIFMDMRVGTDVIDIQKDTIPDLDAYETVVLLLSDLDPLKEKVLDICEWVEDGGSAMFALTLQKNTYVSLIEQKLGIISSGYENTEVDSIYFDKEFLIGGGQAYTIMDPYDSAWEVELAETARVYARVGDQSGTPVIWEEDYGKGRFVVDNFGLYEKAVRGFYAASYSLLTDAGVYPVINGSVFYLDDFPSPVPGGDGTYVRRGYNHQPLSLSNVDYGDVLPYKTWISMKAMQDALGELIRFGKEMFPGTELSVYVPPSNVLSEEGRKMLAEKFPEIRTIASNYFPGEYAYVQEFETADDGIVEQPRIISGAIIDDYMQMAALSELNMHFVNSHFMHPDDLLDEDRGAALGWEKLRARLDEYMTWMNESAPSLRNLTGSELAGAVQRYGALTVDKEITDQEIRIHLGNFYDEAYLMVRINDGTPGQVTGGELTNVTGNLYLLHAQESEVVIERN